MAITRVGCVAGLAVLTALGAIACSGSGTISDPPRATSTATSAAPVGLGSPVAGGCGRTPVRTGTQPGWATNAAAPEDRWVLSTEGNLLGVLFVELRGGRRGDGANNKILWIVNERRTGPLHLQLRPTGGGPAVTQTEPADSSPGEIYPSIVDVPTPGCWHVSAEWNGHHATLDLLYGS